MIPEREVLDLWETWLKWIVFIAILFLLTYMTNVNIFAVIGKMWNGVQHVHTS